MANATGRRIATELRFLLACCLWLAPECDPPRYPQLPPAEVCREQARRYAAAGADARLVAAWSTAADLQAPHWCHWTTATRWGTQDGPHPYWDDVPDVGAGLLYYHGLERRLAGLIGDEAFRRGWLPPLVGE